MSIVKSYKRKLPFLFLAIGILISCISYIVSNMEVKISTNDINVVGENEILKGTRIYQDIYSQKFKEIRNYICNICQKKYR